MLTISESKDEKDKVSFTTKDNCIHIFFATMCMCTVMIKPHFIGFVNKTQVSGLPNNINTCKNVKLKL